MPAAHLSNFSQKFFIDTSLQLPLLAYSLVKFANDPTRVAFNHLYPLIPVSIPLLSGFFGRYLSAEKRAIHTILFMSPINEDPNALSTAKKCHDSTKRLLIDSMYQQETVLVVDERLYRSCMKVRKNGCWGIYVCFCLFSVNR